MITNTVVGRGRSARAVDGYTVSRLSAGRGRVGEGRGRVTGSPRLYKQCILTSAPHTEQLPHRTPPQAGLSVVDSTTLSAVYSYENVSQAVQYCQGRVEQPTLLVEPDQGGSSQG